MDVVAIVLVVLGAFVIVSPWLTALSKRRRGEKDVGVSFVPLLGPGLCAIGCAILGAPWWVYPIPIVLDFGTLAIPFVLEVSAVTVVAMMRTILLALIAGCGAPAPAPSRPPVEVLPRDAVCRSEIVFVHAYTVGGPDHLAEQLQSIAPAFTCATPTIDSRHPKQRVCAFHKEPWCAAQGEVSDAVWRQFEALARHPSVAAILPGHIK